MEPFISSKKDMEDSVSIIEVHGVYYGIRKPYDYDRGENSWNNRFTPSLTYSPIGEQSSSDQNLEFPIDLQIPATQPTSAHGEPPVLILQLRALTTSSSLLLSRGGLLISRVAGVVLNLLTELETFKHFKSLHLPMVTW